MKFIILIFWILIGYISGSFPTGYLLGKMRGINLTKIGSGGTGATNVLRNLGKGPAIITLLVDVLKGFLPVYLSLKFTGCHFTAMFVAFASVIGHSKSVFLKFKGGKSSATGLGVLLALSYEVALITFSIWLIVVLTSRYSSLGSIVAIPFVPILLYLFHKPTVYIIFGVCVAVYIVLIRHKDNIKRLLNGTEPKIGEKK